jgi:hypothetical protein
MSPFYSRYLNHCLRYGCANQAIRRSVIQKCGPSCYPMVEVYPLQFTVLLDAENETEGKKELTVSISRTETLDKLKDLVVQILALKVSNDTDIRLLSSYERDDKDITIHEDFTQILDGSRLEQDRYIRIEMKSSNGTWPSSETLYVN